MSYMNKQGFVRDLKHLVVLEEALGCEAVQEFRLAAVEGTAANIGGVGNCLKDWNCP